MYSDHQESSSSSSSVTFFLSSCLRDGGEEGDRPESPADQLQAGLTDLLLSGSASRFQQSMAASSVLLWPTSSSISVSRSDRCCTRRSSRCFSSCCWRDLIAERKRKETRRKRHPRLRAERGRALPGLFTLWPPRSSSAAPKKTRKEKRVLCG